LLIYGGFVLNLNRDGTIERGQTDKFIVELKSIGVLSGMFISYGKGDVFGTEKWLLAGVRVYDPILGVIYSVTTTYPMWEKSSLITGSG
jgi:hypothetical protein